MWNRQERRWCWWIVLVSPLMAAALPVLADAQPTGADNSLQEVVVTAQRRAEPLQDVPASVAVFTQSTLDAQEVRGIDDLARLSPGIGFSRDGEWTTGNGAASTISIRGISSIAGTATTAIYIDDTPIQTRNINLSSENPYPALFDLDRVEVLRGPQGTLFGASAEGGAVRFVSPDPSLTRASGYDLAEFSTTDGGAPSYQVGAAAGGPIVENTLGFRVSASFRKDGGWVNRVDFATGAPLYPDSNWQQTGTLRAALAIAPTGSLRITPSFYYQDQYLNDTESYWKGLSNPGADQFNDGNAIASPNHDRFYLPALKIEWDLGAARLISSTSYFSRQESTTTDATFVDRATFVYFFSQNFPTFPFPGAGDTASEQSTDRQYNFVQEVRLESADDAARLRWVAGLFYEHARENTSTFIHDPNLPDDFAAAAGYPFESVFGSLLPGGFLLQTPYALAVDRQFAAFGQIDWKPVAPLTLTVGLRVSQVDSLGAESAMGPYIGPAPIANSASITEHPVTPKFGISYQPAKGQLFYASASEGYRIGGINAPLSSLCDSNLASLGLTSGPTSYKSDHAWSYEVGGKNSLLGGRMILDTSAFYIKWSGIQNTVYLPSCGFSFVSNLGYATSRGADLELTARPIDALQLGLSASYTDAHYGETVYASPAAANSLVGAGDSLPVPPWTIVASSEYSLPMLRDFQPYVRLDYQVSTAFRRQPFSDPTNVFYDPAVFWAQKQTSLSARAGIRFNGLDISVFGTNLANSHPVLFDSRYFQPVPIFFDTTARPRTLGLTATFHY
jgi:iron complex outermembrane recepter protein